MIDIPVFGCFQTHEGKEAWVDLTHVVAIVGVSPDEEIPVTKTKDQPAPPPPVRDLRDLSEVILSNGVVISVVGKPETLLDFTMSEIRKAEARQASTLRPRQEKAEA